MAFREITEKGDLTTDPDFESAWREAAADQSICPIEFLSKNLPAGYTPEEVRNMFITAGIFKRSKNRLYAFQLSNGLDFHNLETLNSLSIVAVPEPSELEDPYKYEFLIFNRQVASTEAERRGLSADESAQMSNKAISIWLSQHPAENN